MKKVLLLIASVVLFHSQKSLAADFGDRFCNVFTGRASNVITGGNGNHYLVKVAVSKALASKYQNQLTVGIVYRTDNNQAYQTATNFKLKSTLDDYYVFEARLPEGATHRSARLEFISFVSNGQNRLFDNSYGQQTQKLDARTNWSYRSSNCSVI